MPDAATVDEVVADAIEQFLNGPSRIVGEHLRGAALLLGGMPRNDAVGFMVQASATRWADAFQPAGWSSSITFPSGSMAPVHDAACSHAVVGSSTAPLSSATIGTRSSMLATANPA